MGTEDEDLYQHVESASYKLNHINTNTTKRFYGLTTALKLLRAAIKDPRQDGSHPAVITDSGAEWRAGKIESIGYTNEIGSQHLPPIITLTFEEFKKRRCPISFSRTVSDEWIDSLKTLNEIRRG